MESLLILPSSRGRIAGRTRGDLRDLKDPRVSDPMRVHGLGGPGEPAEGLRGPEGVGGGGGAVVEVNLRVDEDVGVPEDGVEFPLLHAEEGLDGEPLDPPLELVGEEEELVELLGANRGRGHARLDEGDGVGFGHGCLHEREW